MLIKEPGVQLILAVILGLFFIAALSAVVKRECDKQGWAGIMRRWFRKRKRKKW